MPEKSKPLVFLGLPSYDGKISVGTAEAYYVSASLGACEVVRARAASSFLTKTFNDLWCGALNARSMGVTHFAMIHADIIPDQPGWLDTLLGELIRLDADMVSAVSPIKSPHGWTSTAIQVGESDPWQRRRLTMHEVYQLPETFNAEDVRGVLGFHGPLLLNTGLWVCRLDKPWCERVLFDVYNRLVRNPESGRFHAQAIAEDWLISSALNELGCKLYATRKVTLTHEGGADYRTNSAWGTQQTDEVFLKLAKQNGERNENQVHEGVPNQGRGVAHEAARATVP